MISLNLMKLSEVKKAGDQPIIILKKLAFEFLLQKECKLCIVVVFLFQIDFIRISHAIKITNLTMVFGAIIAVAISLAILVNFG